MKEVTAEIYVKYSDLCHIGIKDIDNNTLSESDKLPNCMNDEFTFKIDIESGKILNWDTIREELRYGDLDDDLDDDLDVDTIWNNEGKRLENRRIGNEVAIDINSFDYNAVGYLTKKDWVKYSIINNNHCFELIAYDSSFFNKKTKDLISTLSKNKINVNKDIEYVELFGDYDINGISKEFIIYKFYSIIELFYTNSIYDIIPNGKLGLKCSVESFDMCKSLLSEYGCLKGDFLKNESVYYTTKKSKINRDIDNSILIEFSESGADFSFKG